jgi:hypothetical protein
MHEKLPLTDTALIVGSQKLSSASLLEEPCHGQTAN